MKARFPHSAHPGQTIAGCHNRRWQLLCCLLFTYLLFQIVPLVLASDQTEFADVGPSLSLAFMSVHSPLERILAVFSTRKC